jgi:hypothetical protein
MLVVGVWGCIDEIELGGAGGGAGKMVIQGQLIKGCPSSIRIRVSRTADFTGRSLPEPVPGATVFVLNETGNQLFVPEVKEGIYQLEISDDNPDMTVDTGENYMITVATSEGSQYQSTMEWLHTVPNADSVSIMMVEREELDLNNQRQSKRYLQFFLHTSLEANESSERAFLRWTFGSIYRVDETFVPGPGPGPQTCFVTRGLNFDKVVVFNGNEANSDRLENYFLLEDELGFKFALGYLLETNQHSLSKGAYEYWDQVSQSVALSGGLFEATPGKIVGNMSSIDDPLEEVFGYFYASEEQKITRFVTPDEAGRPEDFCSSSLISGEQVCLDCVTIPFSTTEIPKHWEQ